MNLERPPESCCYIIIKDLAFSQGNEAVLSALWIQAGCFFFFCQYKAESRFTRAHRSLSADGLEQKGCVIEHFKTQADDCLVAPGDMLTLWMQTVSQCMQCHTLYHSIYICAQTRTRFFFQSHLSVNSEGCRIALDHKISPFYHL